MRGKFTPSEHHPSQITQTHERVGEISKARSHDSGVPTVCATKSHVHVRKRAFASSSSLAASEHLLPSLGHRFQFARSLQEGSDADGSLLLLLLLLVTLVHGQAPPASPPKRQSSPQFLHKCDLMTKCASVAPLRERLRRSAKQNHYNNKRHEEKGKGQALLLFQECCWNWRRPVRSEPDAMREWIH